MSMKKYNEEQELYIALLRCCALHCGCACDACRGAEELLIYQKLHTYPVAAKLAQNWIMLKPRLASFLEKLSEAMAEADDDVLLENPERPLPLPPPAPFLSCTLWSWRNKG